MTVRKNGAHDVGTRRRRSFSHSQSRPVTPRTLHMCLYRCSMQCCKMTRRTFASTPVAASMTAPKRHSSALQAQDVKVKHPKLRAEDTGDPLFGVDALNGCQSFCCSRALALLTGLTANAAAANGGPALLIGDARPSVGGNSTFDDFGVRL